MQAAAATGATCGPVGPFSPDRTGVRAAVSCFFRWADAAGGVAGGGNNAVPFAGLFAAATGLGAGRPVGPLGPGGTRLFVADFGDVCGTAAGGRVASFRQYTLTHLENVKNRIE